MTTLIDKLTRNSHLAENAVADAEVAAFKAGNGEECQRLRRLRWRMIDVLTKARIHRQRMNRQTEEKAAKAKATGADLSPEWRAFVSGMTPHAAAKATKAIRVAVSRNGRITTRHDLCLKLAGEGWTAGAFNGKPVALSPDGGWLDSGQITATAIRFLATLNPS